jgi:hypothetical protein
MIWQNKNKMEKNIYENALKKKSLFGCKKYLDKNETKLRS